MPRYFIEISYDGTSFHGWQRQSNSLGVQQVIEEAFSMIYRDEIEILGCGRTDAGVHASSFIFHVDLPTLDDNKLFRANSIVPKSINFISWHAVHDEAHARFDATKRGYIYYAHSHKSPFLRQFSSRIIELNSISLDQLNETASLLLNYGEFATFCKAHSDNKTMKCELSRCEWFYNEATRQYILYVESDRFLRGMIRLIVGACVQVAKGDLLLEHVKEALDKQVRLEKSLSAPPQGLFLNKVEYEFIESI